MLNKLNSLTFYSGIAALTDNLTVKQIQNMLIVTWDDDYHLCRNFTVFLNGSEVTHCTNMQALTSCNVKFTEAGASYIVTVHTTESFQMIGNVSKLVTTVITVDQPSGDCHTQLQ